MKRYHVYGLGAALVDTEIEVTDADLTAMKVDKGVMTLVDESRQHELLQHLSGRLVHSRRASGGSAANSIIGVAQFGGRAYYSCRVADDVALLHEGRIAQHDTPKALLAEPAPGYVASFVAASLPR